VRSGVHHQQLSGHGASSDDEPFHRVGDVTRLSQHAERCDGGDAVEWLVVGARAVTGQLLVVDAGTHLTISTPSST